MLSVWTVYWIISAKLGFCLANKILEIKLLLALLKAWRVVNCFVSFILRFQYFYSITALSPLSFDYKYFYRYLITIFIIFEQPSPKAFQHYSRWFHQKFYKQIVVGCSYHHCNIFVVKTMFFGEPSYTISNIFNMTDERQPNVLPSDKQVSWSYKFLLLQEIPLLRIVYVGIFKFFSFHL